MLVHRPSHRPSEFPCLEIQSPSGRPTGNPPSVHPEPPLPPPLSKWTPPRWLTPWEDKSCARAYWTIVLSFYRSSFRILSRCRAIYPVTKKKDRCEDTRKAKRPGHRCRHVNFIASPPSFFSSHLHRSAYDSLSNPNCRSGLLAQLFPLSESLQLNFCQDAFWGRTLSPTHAQNTQP